MSDVSWMDPLAVVGTWPRNIKTPKGSLLDFGDCERAEFTDGLHITLHVEISIYEN